MQSPTGIGKLIKYWAQRFCYALEVNWHLLDNHFIEYPRILLYLRPPVSPFVDIHLCIVNIPKVHKYCVRGRDSQIRQD